MTDFELLTAADVRLMQGLAQRVTALRPDHINGGASYGELSWIWGQGSIPYGKTWPRRLWYSDGELVAWGWAFLPREVRRNDGSVSQVTGASLSYQIHPEHTDLIDEVIEWYEAVTLGLERTVLPTNAEEYALTRWAAHGYRSDAEALGEDGDWTQLNERDLDEIQPTALAKGFRFRTADEVGPQAVVQAHVDAWYPSSYSVRSYQAVRETAAYRGDLHLLVEAPDGTMAASTIMWFDEANKSIEFEPVGTHPDYRRLGLARSMMLQGMRQAVMAGATHATVVCLGAPGHPAARALYYGLGFRELSRDVPLIKAAETAG
ncbi:GNAT family N-acetyltransferase [Actinospica durhamensis]|uniref:GNAT family N-acetyltransferase n=1 Tax=Actinospica durhamensis TaxID=1508375 RepID=A0A941EXN2_9ACTN|nr:GNAT family N-acetyltransferase [Actinospica durhamensis]MBR7838896.1 GNAT family N-acetyltransferase [Actinospica durhamensis]